MSIDEQKQAAGELAATWVESGMVVGLGTGSTAVHAIRAIGARIESGELREVLGIPTSRASEAEAIVRNVPLTTLAEHPVVDLTIDGADEVDAALDLIKGAGGALWREKMVAQASVREVIVVDDTKPSPQLGHAVGGAGRGRAVRLAARGRVPRRPRRDGDRAARRRRRGVRDRRGQLDPRLRVRSDRRSGPARRRASTDGPASSSTGCSSVSPPICSSRARPGVEHRTRP